MPYRRGEYPNLAGKLMFHTITNMARWHKWLLGTVALVLADKIPLRHGFCGIILRPLSPWANKKSGELRKRFAAAVMVLGLAGELSGRALFYYAVVSQYSWF